MESGEHKVTGEGGFDCNFCSLEVSNFADENDVWILPQKGAQCSGEIQSDLLFHLDLIHSAQLEFDRVFRGHNVGVRLIQPRDGGIQSVGLAGSSGSRDQYHSVRFQNRFFEFDQ